MYVCSYFFTQMQPLFGVLQSYVPLPKVYAVDTHRDYYLYHLCIYMVPGATVVLSKAALCCAVGHLIIMCLILNDKIMHHVPDDQGNIIGAHSVLPSLLAATHASCCCSQLLPRILSERDKQAPIPNPSGNASRPPSGTPPVCHRCCTGTCQVFHLHLYCLLVCT